MGRRSVWDDEHRENQWGGSSALPAPLTVLEQIPVAATRRKPDRRKRDSVVTFRGVPEELHNQVKKIAEGLGVPVGEVARYLFEFGLGAMERGELRLNPTLAAGRRTLFPPKGWGAASYTPASALPRRKARKGNGPKVSYRGIPPEIVERIEKESGRFAVPVGELARRLLEFGIDAYQAGKLPVQTYVVTTKNTLYG